MTVAMLASLLIAAAGLSRAETTELDRTVVAIFAPYRQPENMVSAWEQPIYSREVAQLIAKWRSVAPTDEIDALSGGDWLCQCQDWDHRNFRVKVAARKPGKAGAVEVKVDLRIGWGARRDAFLSFRREEGRWVLDDMFSEEYSDGLKQALRQTIAEDEALKEAAQ